MENPWPGGDDAPIIRAPAIRRPRKTLRAVILAVVLGATALTAYRFWPQLEDLVSRLTKGQAESAGVESNATGRTKPTGAGGAYPRRLLSICIHNYLYMNPVGYGEGGDQNFHTLTERIGRVLHVAPSQVVELSDATPPRLSEPPVLSGTRKKKPDAPSAQPAVTPRPPLKNVLEKTIADFLDNSRAQDRIILVFIGHVVEIGDEAFLVPLEGEPAVKESLLPLSWLYEKLRQCKARQKVLLLDTCRLDPGLGFERPGSGPMGAKLAALLAKPPAGVQVWSSCGGGEFSYELDGSGVFLDKLFASLASQSSTLTQQPEDALPIELLAESVDKATTASVSEEWQLKQSPRLSGQEAQEGASYESGEPLPARLEIAAPTLPGSDLAAPAEVRSILREIDLPPLKVTRQATTPLEFETLVPFSAKVLTDYRPDYQSLKEIEGSPERYPLRVAVLETVNLLKREFDRGNDAFSLQDSFRGSQSESLKKEILSRQMKTARVLGRLREALDNLRKAGEEREQEKSKRWQAHYDLVLADLLARMAYVIEYDLMLGKIRKDELPMPESGPAPSGWRLASRDKLSSGKEGKETADEAKKIYAKLIKKHKGTPWEILARREQLTALGLEWHALR